MMYENRRFKRLPVDLRLEISSLFKQDNEVVENIHEPIDVFNISKSGIGFKTTGDLPLGYYFNACITLGRDDSKLYTVVKIIRQQKCEGDKEYIYGCEFVGLAPVLMYIFDEYEEKMDNADF